MLPPLPKAAVVLHPVLAAERRAVIALLAGSSARLAELLPLVERDAEIEALHQFRVELRRVRTVIKALAPGRCRRADRGVSLARRARQRAARL
jgi:hypothetical protein